MIKKPALPMLVLLLVCSFSVAVRAQTNDPKVYTDVHAVAIHLVNESVFDFGIGSRTGYNFTKHLAVEGEVNYFPANEISHGGKKEQGFVSLKAGKRFDRVGFFAKAGPGFMNLSKGGSKLVPDRSGCSGQVHSIICFDTANNTNLAGNLSGVFEVYTSKRTFIRFDAGSTFLEGGPYLNNFQTSSGFGVRS